MLNLTEEKEFLLRLKECKACEHRKMGVCTKCGCVIQFKLRLPKEECPIGKWQAIQNTSTSSPNSD